MLGGSTRPLSSPCTMMMAPMIRVDIPQEVWCTYCSWLSLSEYWMPKALGEAVAEVVAGTGLQCLAIVHQSLDGVGRLERRRTSPYPSCVP